MRLHFGIGMVLCLMLYQVCVSQVDGLDQSAPVSIDKISLGLSREALVSIRGLPKKQTQLRQKSHPSYFIWEYPLGLKVILVNNSVVTGVVGKSAFQNGQTIFKVGQRLERSDQNLVYKCTYVSSDKGEQHPLPAELDVSVEAKTVKTLSLCTNKTKELIGIFPDSQ